MEELIAVIVPVYNTQEYVECCVRSIVAQDYHNLDIILVDDGSTDASYEVCQKLANQDKRITVLHKDNGGILSAKCMGLDHTDAEYVMFIDSDDWIKPEMCRKLYETLQQFQVDIVVSGIIRAFPDGRYKYDYNALPPGEYRDRSYKKEIIPHMLCNGTFFQWGIDPSTAIKIFKKKLIHPIIKKAMGYGFYYGEDTAVVYPYLLQVDSIYILDQCFYFHRQYENHVEAYINDFRYHEKINELYLYLKNIFRQHIQYNDLVQQLNYFYAYALYMPYIYNVKKVANRFQEPTAISYLFPFGKISKGSKVLLYGAGNVGKVFYNQLKKSNFCSELIWVDKDFIKYQKQNLPVQDPEISITCDYCVIAVADREIADKIKSSLMNRQIQADKIIWEDPLLHLW